MKFFKKVTEFNNLAKGFNGVYQLINELEAKINNHYSTDYSEFEDDLFFLAYLSQNAILNRIEIYNWDMNSRIIVPMINKGYSTLIFVYQETIGRIYILSEKLLILDKVTEILDKGNAYYEIDKTIPSHIKHMIT